MKATYKPYRLPSGGWGSARSVGNILRREGVLGSASVALSRHNKVDGYQCNSCAWVKPATPLPFEFCENGVKAVAWELTAHRCTPAFFAEHTVSELLTWDDYHLEQPGRLTHPLRYDPATDKYMPVSWGHAIAEIAHELRAVEDKQHGTVFYSSGRLSNEGSYLYQLFARLYGNNNLPDSSNMCHETTSVALPASIGQGVGTVDLGDFATTDCLMFFGQNPGSNSPRMLHPLQEASQRGVPIITFNPLRERGLERFLNPQSPTEMLTGKNTRISSDYHQVKNGGDLAAIAGICKAVLTLHDDALAAGEPPILDLAFIEEHTHGFERFAEWLRVQDWDELERRSGLHRADLEATALIYARAHSTIGIYGMGLTQHRDSSQTVQQLVNLLLLKGNIGRPGAGICPLRGHSNVQGNRTVGIWEKPSEALSDSIRDVFGFEPPRAHGHTVIETIAAMERGEAKVFVGLGGNFAVAAPDPVRTFAAMRKLDMAVHIATKPNRTHMLIGKAALLLPCLGRTELDVRAGVRQSVTVEDSMSMVHASRGLNPPASEHLLSEPAIVAGIATATFGQDPLIDWLGLADDYDAIRDLIARVFPAAFEDYNEKVRVPGGFRLPVGPSDRVWKTATGKANFLVFDPKGGDPRRGDPDVLILTTLRSHDQYNTTIYGQNDRYRGVFGRRDVVFANPDDMARMGLAEGDLIDVGAAFDESGERVVRAFTVVARDIPPGCLAAYYPETNVVIALDDHDQRSGTPAYKSAPVRLRKHQAEWRSMTSTS